MNKAQFLKMAFTVVLVTSQSNGADLLDIVRNPNLINHEVSVQKREDRNLEITKITPKVRVDRLWWCFVANNVHQELTLAALTKLYAPNSILPPKIKDMAVQTLPNASDKEIRLALEYIYFDRTNKILKLCPIKYFHSSGRI